MIPESDTPSDIKNVDTNYEASVHECSQKVTSQQTQNIAATLLQYCNIAATLLQYSVFAGI